MRDSINPAALRALGIDPDNAHAINLREPLSVSGLIGLMREAPAHRTFLVSNKQTETPLTYRLRIAQMTVRRGEDRIVADGVRLFTESEMLSVTGLLITGQLLAISDTITETPLPSQPMDYVAYLECSEGDTDTEPLARVLWIEFPTPQERQATDVQSGYTTEQQRWRAMGVIPGLVSRICPLGEVEWLNLPELLENAGLDPVDRTPEQPVVLTTDDAWHAVHGERYSVALKLTDIQPVTTGDVTGYRFTAQMLGAQPGSEPVRTVELPFANGPVLVRGFIEPAANGQPLTFWIQIMVQYVTEVSLIKQLAM